MRYSRSRETQLRHSRPHHKVGTSGDRLFKRVLVGIDGSKDALRAAKVAAKLAKRSKAELLVVSAVQRPIYVFSPAHGVVAPTMTLGDYYMYANKEAEKWVDDAVSLTEGQDVKATGHVLKNARSVVRAITEYAAEQEVDLIVVGRRGMSGFKRLLLGSVSAGIVSHAHASVLVVK
jgi:nucleotide-binding universal stress UspA family protein